MPDLALFGSNLDTIDYGSGLQPVFHGLVSTAKTWSVTADTWSATYAINTVRVHGTITVPEMGGAVVGFNIIRPISYTGTLPVYFFQHGKGGSETTPLSGGANAVATKFDLYIGAGGTPAMLVCVNFGDNSFGYNAEPDATEYGHFVEDFFFNSLIPHLAANYDADTTKMVAMGFSMGGCEMFRYVSKHGSMFLGAAMFDSPMPALWSGAGGFNTTDNATTLAWLGATNGQTIWEADNPRYNFAGALGTAFHASYPNVGFYLARGSSGVTSQSQTWPGSSASDNIKLLLESLGYTPVFAQYTSGHVVSDLMGEDNGAVFTWAETLIQAAVSTAPPGMGRIRSSRHYPMRY